MKRFALRIAEVLGFATIVVLTFAVMLALAHVVDTIFSTYQALTGD